MMYKNYLLQLTRKCITWKPKRSNPKKTCYIDISMGYATKHSWAWKPTSQSANLGPRYLSECHQVKKARNCPGRHPKQFQGLRFAIITWNNPKKIGEALHQGDNLATCQSLGARFLPCNMVLMVDPEFCIPTRLTAGLVPKNNAGKGKRIRKASFFGAIKAWFIFWTHLLLVSGMVLPKTELRWMSGEFEKQNGTIFSGNLSWNLAIETGPNCSIVLP